MVEDYKSTGENIPIKRGKVDSLTVYDITDYELDQLEKGSPSSIYLNFAILLISIGTSFLISILTTKIDSERVFNVFVIITAIGFIIGIILLILWYRERKPLKNTINKIRRRIPPDN